MAVRVVLPQPRKTRLEHVCMDTKQNNDQNKLPRIQNIGLEIFIKHCNYDQVFVAIIFVLVNIANAYTQEQHGQDL